MPRGVKWNGSSIALQTSANGLSRHERERNPPVVAPKRAATLAVARDHLVEGLRIMSRGDDHVTMLLDAYQSGCEERADVLDCTGMSADEYRNARRRLDRLVDALPETIKDGAIDALEVSYGY